jgi:hypothetical protein
MSRDLTSLINCLRKEEPCPGLESDLKLKYYYPCKQKNLLGTEVDVYIWYSINLVLVSSPSVSFICTVEYR